MQARGFWTLCEVSDNELDGRLKELLRAGGRTEARIVAHLAEVDARRLHLRGAPSLFQYCLSELGFSESEAWYRICAARAGRRFPVIFELLEKRELHLTAVALLSKYLTPENQRDLLGEARGKTKQRLLELLASRWPKADVSSQLRRIPAGAVAAGPTATLEPRSAETYCLRLCASRELKAKLEQARDLMSHANPSGDLAVVVERALELLIQRLRARHFGQTGTSRRPARPREPASRNSSPVRELHGPNDLKTHDPNDLKTHDPNELRDKPKTHEQECETRALTPPRKRRRIGQAVRRQVAARDAECCCHVGPDGKRCEARAFLELHHEKSWALGGDDSVDNLSLRCRAHNRLMAEQELGAARVEQAIERRRKQAELRPRCDE